MPYSCQVALCTMYNHPMLRLRPKLSPIQPSTLGGVQEIFQLVQELKSLKEQLVEMQQMHAEMMAQNMAENKDKMAEIESHVLEAKNHIKTISKGEKGDTILPPTLGEIIEAVKPLIPKPIDGITPTVDYKKAATLAAQLIPKPKDGESVDEKSVIEKVIDTLVTGKKKLNIKHIEGYSEGLEQTIAPIRSLAAGFRGGGDTVSAGSGISISTVNGVKTITATGSGVTYETPTGTVNGSNNIFTVTATPLFVIVDGVTYFENNGYTLAGLTITTSVPPTGFIRSAY